MRRTVPVVLLAVSATVVLPGSAAQAKQDDAGTSVTAPCGRMSSVLTLHSTATGLVATYHLGPDRRHRRWQLSLSRDGEQIASVRRTSRRPSNTVSWQVALPQAAGAITVVASAGATHCEVAATATPSAPPPSGSSSGSSSGSGGGSTSVDSIVVSKCYTNATKTTGGELLIKASSSDPNAQLLAYRPDGSLIGEVQNGGGGRYGGTVMPYQSYDPGTVTIRSSSGGSVTVPTGPFQL